jgi:hypothetical protein
MAKDNAIRDQKVFVRLGAVLEFQKLYTEVSTSYARAKDILAVATTSSTDMTDSAKAAAHTEFRYCIGRKQAFERVIRMLELPIEIPIGA